MKCYSFLVLAAAWATGPESFGQAVSKDQQEAAQLFAAFKAASAKEAGRLWGQPLYGPTLLVNPDTREVFANEPDSAGAFRPVGAIYTGLWPAQQLLGNTALVWQGKQWTMMVWPLPQEEPDRTVLAFHEFFHRLQPGLGFKMADADNQHLDEQPGRTYLRLELMALEAALRTSKSAERTAHVRNALLFRRYRYRLYPAAAANENTLEMNEGLAEYTGLMAAECRPEQRVEYLLRKTDAFYQNPTFVRSFAYYTVPAYGYLLQQQQPAWHRAVHSDTDLTALFAKAFGGSALPVDLKTAVEQAAPRYNSDVIVRTETQRETERQQRIATYRKKFVDAPGLVIQLIRMNISFDPRTLQPLGSSGMLYPKVVVSDRWGTLTAEGGALLSPNKDKITVPAPTHITAQEVAGEGYRLSLSPGWVVEKSPDSGGYLVRKK